MSSLAIVIPIAVVTWIGGLALIVALCRMSARSDRATRIAMRQAVSEREPPSGVRSRQLVL